MNSSSSAPSPVNDLPLLELRDITVRFGGLVAAENVSFSVPANQIRALIGPNGAGKTTVFNCISGVYSPTSGTITVAGADIRNPYSLSLAMRCATTGVLCGFGLAVAINVQTLWDSAIVQLFPYGQAFPWSQLIPKLVETVTKLPLTATLLPTVVGSVIGSLATFTTWARSRHSPVNAIHRGIARTFQNIRLFRELSVLDNVLVGMHAHCSSSALNILIRGKSYRAREREQREAALSLLEFVGIAPLVHEAARSLPYGDQRRLEIARALATNPRILLLDEPAAGMNPSELGSLMELISKIRTRGVTVLLIEHHMKLVMGISDFVTVLEHGEKISEGDPEKVQRDPKVIAAYLGEATDG